jgi:uncharacterized tellurite resistance protein B-like protein
MSTFELDPILKSHFLNLYSIALADNVFDTTELEMLYRIANERNIDNATIDKIIESPYTGNFCIPETLQEKIKSLYDFARIIWADGKIKEPEVVALEKFCIQFGFLEENAQKIAQFLIEQVKEGKSLDEVILIVDQNL